MASHDVRAVEMEEALWGLLERYVMLLNKRLKKQGLPRVSKGQVLGALASRFLLAHRTEIMEEHASQELEKQLGVAVRAAGPHGLALSDGTFLSPSTVSTATPERVRARSRSRR